MGGINRENKDRLFKFIFGNEQNKAWTLSLYNSINQSSYTNPNEIQLTTIEDVLYMGMKNDISFIIADMMNIYEQQSTFNPNMPMRCLIYVGMLYSKYAENLNNKINLYSKKLQKFPMPKLICFYNGTDDKDEKMILNLNDAFYHETNNVSDVDVRVTMININYGKNNELLKSCQALNEYSWFIDRIRRNQEKTGDLEAAVDEAINEMPETALIKPFLLSNKAEVRHMCITEYDEARTMELFKEEAREQGRKEGRKEGKKEGKKEGWEEGLKSLVNTLKKFTSNIETLYAEIRNNEEYSNVTLEQIRKYY